MYVNLFKPLSAMRILQPRDDIYVLFVGLGFFVYIIYTCYKLLK